MSLWMFPRVWSPTVQTVITCLVCLQSSYYRPPLLSLWSIKALPLAVDHKLRHSCRVQRATASPSKFVLYLALLCRKQPPSSREKCVIIPTHTHILSLTHTPLATVEWVGRDGTSLRAPSSRLVVHKRPVSFFAESFIPDHFLLTGSGSLIRSHLSLTPGPHSSIPVTSFRRWFKC